MVVTRLISRSGKPSEFRSPKRRTGLVSLGILPARGYRWIFFRTPSTKSPISNGKPSFSRQSWVSFDGYLLWWTWRKAGGRGGGGGGGGRGSVLGSTVGSSIGGTGGVGGGGGYYW